MPRGDAPAHVVLDHALALFAQYGVRGTSLQMISDSIGATKAAAYRYRTKEEIVRAALSPASDELDDLLEQVALVAERERQLVLVEHMARQAVKHRMRYAILLQDVRAAQMRQETPGHLATFRRLRDTLAGSTQTRAWARAAIFLSGLTGPAVDPGLRDLGDAELEAAIIAAGRGILSLG